MGTGTVQGKWLGGGGGGAHSGWEMVFWGPWFQTRQNELRKCECMVFSYCVPLTHQPLVVKFNLNMTISLHIFCRFELTGVKILSITQSVRNLNLGPGRYAHLLMDGAQDIEFKPLQTALSWTVMWKLPDCDCMQLWWTTWMWSDIAMYGGVPRRFEPSKRIYSCFAFNSVDSYGWLVKLLTYLGN